jgi:hypothetical protein
VLSAAFAIAAALTGCGITDPYTARHPAPATTASTTPTATALTDADPAPERGGTIPAGASAAQRRTTAGAGQDTPQAALVRYARLYVNWTASTIASVQSELATISIDQARAEALQAAASYAHDQTLTESGVANSGHLVALTSNLTAPGQWVLVTTEQTTGKGDYAGLPATLHVTYAQVAHTASGWVISEWSPQN